MSEQTIERVMGEACANCHGSGIGMDGKACPFAPHKQATYKIKTTKLKPGSEAYFAMMGAEFGYNFLGDHEYRAMQAYSRKLWEAALATKSAPLTDSRMDEVLSEFGWDCPKTVLRLAGRAVEAAHGISATQPQAPQGGVTDAERYEFLCSVTDEVTMDFLAECIGSREHMNALVDELIKEQKSTAPTTPEVRHE